MKKIKPNLILTLIIIILAIGLLLSTWKMFQFRDRLHDFLHNEKWEQTLSEHQLYDENLIVFFGDSQIDLWPMLPSFGVLPIKNRGIYGDFAEKATERFDRDVIQLKPKVLVILIGTNDLGHNQPITTITSDIDSMVKKAINADIQVILCSILPVRGSWTEDRSQKDIQHLNRQLERISLQNKIDYVDLYAELADKNQLFKNHLTTDGLHPNKEGYYQMTKTLFPVLMKNILKQ